MLIREETLVSSANINITDYLHESESTYLPNMVTIRHNSRLDKDLIQLESFVKYGRDNDIDNGGYAIAKVCEANEIGDMDKIAFIVNEEHLYSDDDVVDTFIQIKESGMDVFVSPISDDSIFVTKLREAMMFDESYENYDQALNLQAYVNESIIDDFSSRASSLTNRGKKAASDTVSSLSQKLAAIRKEISLTTSKLGRTVGSTKALLQRKISKLKDAATNVKNKLSRAKEG